MRRIFLALALVVGSAASATACDPVYKKVVCTETVYVSIEKTVPYKKEVVTYDSCGKPICTYEICYKKVLVSVPKTIEVVKYVKVCD